MNFTYDSHGHPELYNVSKSHVFNMLIQRKLRELNLTIGSRPVELGFGIRCSRPIGYDLTYCTLLGLGVYELFRDGISGAMVNVDQYGKVSPLYLRDVEDENGKVIPRLVDVNSPMVQSLVNYNMHYLTPEDYEDALKWVKEPEEFDFHKILEG